MSAVADGLRALADLAGRLADRAPEVERIAARYVASLRAGGTLFFIGNGGSAADAQHLATEYLVRFRAVRRPFRAVALTTDTSVLTAAGNDLGFEKVFARQVEALAGPEDLLIIHSTSGASVNLLRAAEAAKRTGTGIVAWLGRDGGALKALADHAFVVPSDDTSRIQELHLAIEHLIVEWVEREMTS